jgi:hypothetical protein
VCITIGELAFYECTTLTTVSFPSCQRIWKNALGKCSSLTTASFPAASVIGSYAFSGCWRLQSIYLTGSSLCKLSNSNAFTSTPYAGYSASFSGTPYIYVPTSLVNSYKTATNWTYFSKYFSAYENLDLDGGDEEWGDENIFTFIIYDYMNPNIEKEYQAQEGMTWGEWIESVYNVDGFYLDPMGAVQKSEGVFVYNGDSTIFDYNVIEQLAYNFA